MKLTEFEAKVVILGAERTVSFTPAYVPKSGSSDGPDPSALTVDGLTVEEAEGILAALARVTPQIAAAALLEDRTAVVGAGAKALAGTQPTAGPVIVEGARALAAETVTQATPDKPARARRSRPEDGGAPTPPAEKKLRIVDDKDQPIAPAPSVASTTPPAADSLEEDDDDLLDQEMPAWAQVPIDEELKAATKGSQVFLHLINKRGLTNVDDLVAFCKERQKDIPVLAKEPNVEGRARNAHKILTERKAAT